MQTFVTHVDIREIAKCLDYRRLGKQRVEAMQILKALKDPSYGWQNHPAVEMWRGYDEALKYYMNSMITEWIIRGYKNTMKLAKPGKIILPYWWSRAEVIDSHRSNLLRKDPEYYSKFNWNVPDNLPYFWPSREQ